MNSSQSKRKDDKQSTIANTVSAFQKVNRDFKTQMISQMVLNDILQKAQTIKNRNSQVNRFIQTQKLQQSEQFTVDNCGQLLQNFFIEPSSLSPKMTNQHNFVSPSKSPHNFLNYEQLSLETDRMSNPDRRQMWGERRNSSKIYNCNKIYILKRKTANSPSNDRNSSIKSIRLNDTLPSGFGRSSYRPQIKNISINNSTIIPRLSTRGRLTVNTLSQPNKNGSKNDFLQISKNSIYRSSFHDEKSHQKDQEVRDKLIKLENLKLKTSQQAEPKEKQTNEYIAFLRQRKQKLENIMKVFDLDDLQKKNHKIQRQNLLKENKAENFAQTFNKMPSMTTDYEGNPVYLHDSNPKGQGTQQNSTKKLYTRLPKYASHQQGVLSHNVTFKIKDIDDKTKNFLHQIFSSACGTPLRSNKKIGFNMKNLEMGKKTTGKKSQKSQKNMSSKISINYEEKKQESQKLEKQESQNDAYEFNNTNNTKFVKNMYDQSKGLKSALKIPLKSIRNDSQNPKSEINKENLQVEKLFTNLINSDFLNKERTIVKTEQSSRSNTVNKNSLKQLETMHRQGYASQKQRMHPNIFKNKKTTTVSTEGYECNKIVQISNETTERNLVLSEHQTLKTFFEVLMRKEMR